MPHFDFVAKRLSKSAKVLLAKIIPGLNLEGYKEMQFEFKAVLERNADLLLVQEVHKYNLKLVLKVVLNIIHIEFQSSKDKKMMIRMLIYAALIYYHFGYWPTQYVIYMHQHKRNFPSIIWDKISTPFLKYRVRFIYLCRIDADEYINDPDLGVVVFSSIMRFPKGKEAEYYEKILKRIKDAKIPNREKIEHIEEIALLTGLKPKLQETFQKALKKMAIEIDITKIPLYKEGKREGKEETLVEIILNLFSNKKLSKEYIADLLNLPLKVVEDILKKSK